MYLALKKYDRAGLRGYMQAVDGQKRRNIYEFWAGKDMPQLA